MSTREVKEREVGQGVIFVQRDPTHSQISRFPDNVSPDRYPDCWLADQIKPLFIEYRSFPDPHTQQHCAYIISFNLFCKRPQELGIVISSLCVNVVSAAGHVATKLHQNLIARVALKPKIVPLQPEEQSMCHLPY